jgi:DNA-binding protein HU-beta
MNKAELIRRVAGETGLPRSHAERVVSTLLKEIEDALIEGEKVTLVGFGSFNVHSRPARKGRNPKTGEMIKIKPKKVVKFKAGTRLAGNVK